MHSGYSILMSAARQTGGLWLRLKFQMDPWHETESEAAADSFLRPPGFLARSRSGSKSHLDLRGASSDDDWSIWSGDRAKRMARLILLLACSHDGCHGECPSAHDRCYPCEKNRSLWPTLEQSAAFASCSLLFN